MAIVSPERDADGKPLGDYTAINESHAATEIRAVTEAQARAIAETHAAVKAQVRAVAEAHAVAEAAARAQAEARVRALEAELRRLRGEASV